MSVRAILLLLLLLAPGAATCGPPLPRYMTDISQPIPEQLKIPDAPKTARVLAPFHKIQPKMTMVDVVKLCGIPDEHQGSGIFIFIYHLRDGSVVAIGTSDLKHLMYAQHIDNSGKVASLIPPK
jgi:hypothetical protein